MVTGRGVSSDDLEHVKCIYLSISSKLVALNEVSGDNDSSAA